MTTFRHFVSCLAATLLVLATFMGQPLSVSAASSRALHQAAAPVPQPDFFFPLTGNNLSSSTPLSSPLQAIPSPTLQWAADPTFGSVLACNRENQDSIILPGVVYGQQGPFTISFWVKADIVAGQGYEYAYSHVSKENTDVTASGNVIQIYFPQANHTEISYPGIVRAIVRDSQDGPPENRLIPTFLDSDGCVADGACKPSSFSGNPGDGQWHHITLSTQPSGVKGVRMYHDGELVAEMSSPITYEDAQGGQHLPTGGRPMTLDGNLTLCARADLDKDRFFTGSVANLRIYNSALDEDQIKAVVDADLAQSRAARSGAAALINSTAEAVPPSPTAAFVTQALPTPGAVPAMRIAGQPACSPQPVAGLSTLQSCGQGYVCFPLSEAQLQAEIGQQAAVTAFQGQVGVCVYSPEGLLLPDSSKVPAPMAFFPLSSPSLESFPLGEHKAISEGSPAIITDAVFGGALRCNAQDQDLVALDSVLYGATDGSFSVNIWVRPGEDFDSPAPLYVYSHRGTDAASNADANTGWGPNQVQLYFPQADHPAYGVARAYIRDSNDNYTGTESEGYVDSDGLIGNNFGPRSGPFPLLDGAWHMLTLTAQPQGGPGYRLYLDGALAADLNATSDVLSSDGSTPLHIDGGDPLNLQGNIILCSRSDDPAERHFDGDLAYLSLWDATLSPEQIASLYAAVQTKLSWAAAAGPAASSNASETPALSTRQSTTERSTISGQICQFPALYNGEMVTNCVMQGAYEYCPVGNGENWEQCQPLNETAVPPLGSPPSYAAAAAAQKESTGYSTADYSDYYETPADESDLFNSTLVADVPASTGSTARSAFYSADGRICSLPLVYKHDIRVDNCVSFSGGQYCWVVGSETQPLIKGGGGSGQNGEWAACAVDALQEPPSAGILGVGPSTVPVLELQQPLRFTEDGDACVFPTVTDNGLILDDCVVLDGQSKPSCITSGGEWRVCDGVDAENLDEKALFVADRQSISGHTCIFPAVSNGYVWFDCPVVGSTASSTSAIDVTAPSRSREICPTSSGAWEVCASTNGNTTTKTLDIPGSLQQRYSAGKRGHLCSITASSTSTSSSTNSVKCADGLSCVPLPRLVNDTSPASSPLQDAGFCTDRPDGTTFGVFPALSKADAPQPIAFFPLTGGTFEALTLPRYNGTSMGTRPVTWVEDTMFESAPVCNRSSYNAIQLDNVPYAARGPFTVNLFMRRLPGVSSTNGSTFQYLFSHSSYASSPGYSPNQVAIYVPDSGHPAYGGVRAIVKDSNDNAWDLTYLDSDGEIESNANRTSSEKAKTQYGDVNDGNWHMVTVSTLPEGSSGFVLYIDGEQGGILQQPTPVEGDEVAVPTGGDPALMSTDMYLCARSDLSVSDTESRFYDGALANLMLFDAALTADQIKALYETYNPGKYTNESDPGAFLGAQSEAAFAAKDAGLGSGDSTDYSSGYGSTTSTGASAGLVAGIVMAAVGGLAALLAVGALAVSAYRRRQRNKFQRFYDNENNNGNPFARAEQGFGPGGHAGYGGTGNTTPRAAGTALTRPSDATLNIQLSTGTSGKLSTAPSTSILVKDSSIEPAASAAGLHHINHPHKRDTSDLSAVSSTIPAAAGAAAAAGAGNPFSAAATTGVGGGSAPPSPHSLGAHSPMTASTPRGWGGSSNADSTMSDNMEIEAGKKSLFKKKGARIVLPSDLGPDAYE